MARCVMELLMCQIAMEAISQTLCLLIVSGGSVWFAFSRFKREKMWERQFSAYVNIATALGNMLLILGRWQDSLEFENFDGEESNINFNYDYKLSMQEFNNTVAVSGIILHRDVAVLLKKLSDDLEGVDKSCKEMYIANSYGLIEDKLDILVDKGRCQLGA
jgi:hypothetical protein